MPDIELGLFELMASRPDAEHLLVIREGNRWELLGNAAETEIEAAGFLLNAIEGLHDMAAARNN
jgi:hypothetical protein